LAASRPANEAEAIEKMAKEFNQLATKLMGIRRQSGQQRAAYN